MDQLYSKFPELKAFELFKTLFQTGEEYTVSQWGMIPPEENVDYLFIQKRIDHAQVAQHSTVFCFQYNNHKQIFVVLDSPLAFKEWHRKIKCRNYNTKQYAVFNEKASFFEKMADYVDVENFKLDENVYACFIYMPEIENPRKLSSAMGNQFVKYYPKQPERLSVFYETTKKMENFVEQYYEETVIKQQNRHKKEAHKILLDKLLTAAFPT